MLLAFGLGMLLQAAVTEIPALTQAFGTCVLSLSEWGFLLPLAAAPVIVHEIAVLLRR